MVYMVCEVGVCSMLYGICNMGIYIYMLHDACIHHVWYMVCVIYMVEACGNLRSICDICWGIGVVGWFMLFMAHE